MNTKEEQMSEALDLVHDIAASVDEDDPKAVAKAFNDIIALGRYKFNVLPEQNVKSQESS